ncbi:MAG: hypothetical protein JNM20_09415 [Rhizobiales bacterium]|nr:hypothetical protein [Hyphomicrobiales bacterium]
MDAISTHGHTRIGASRTGTMRTGERLAVILVAAIALALGVYFAVWALSRPNEVRPMPPSPPEGSISEGLKLLVPSERQALRERETDALRRDPLDPRALRNLANLWRAEGDGDRAERLAVLAGDRSLRDLPAQAEVLDILLRRKDFAAALYRLDALMRAQPARLPDLVRIAAAFAESDESRPALVAALARNPPWRQALVTAILKNANGPAVAYSVLSDLRKSGSEPNRSELRELISTLMDNKDFDTAYFVWLDFLSQPDLRKAGNIFDGGFEIEPQNLFFGWNFGKLRNTDIRLVPRSTSSADRMLRVEFMNARERFQHVSQVLRLAPGHYTLTGETKAERLVTEVGLVWRLYCLGAKQRPIAQTARLFASSTWASFELPFEIPPEDCGAQKLQLEVDSRASLDQLISGQAYFDNLQIRQGR